MRAPKACVTVEQHCGSFSSRLAALLRAGWLGSPLGGNMLACDLFAGLDLPGTPFDCWLAFWRRTRAIANISTDLARVAQSEIEEVCGDCVLWRS